jgi:cleavage and polyadenylation specificity factor subunit 1
MFHVDQTGRTVAVPSNGWASRVTDLNMTDDANSETRDIALEGSCVVFVDEKKLFVFAADGLVYPVELVVEGRAVTNIIISPPLVQLAIPTTVVNVGQDHVFLGSTVGPSLLLKVVKVQEEVREDASQSADTIVDDSPDGDIDLDDGKSFSYKRII